MNIFFKYIVFLLVIIVCLIFYIIFFIVLVIGFFMVSVGLVLGNLLIVKMIKKLFVYLIVGLGFGIFL